MCLAHLFVVELEDNILVGELAVHLGERLELGLDVDLVLGVQEDAEHLLAVKLDASAFADDLGREHKVLIEKKNRT